MTSFGDWLFSRHERPRSETVEILLANAEAWQLNFKQFLALYVYVGVKTPTTRATLLFAETVKELCIKFNYDYNAYEQLVSPRIGFAPSLSKSHKTSRECCGLPSKSFKTKLNNNKI